jgi:hypothetical protein
MTILWLEIDDDPGPHSRRGFIERNAIALLSNFDKPAIDPPSLGWLGHYSDKSRVKASGLWNQNHVDEKFDPIFLDEFEELASRSAGVQ